MYLKMLITRSGVKILLWTEKYLALLVHCTKNTVNGNWTVAVAPKCSILNVHAFVWINILYLMENKADWKSLISVHKQKDVILVNLAYVAFHNQKLRLHFVRLFGH